MVQQTFSGVPDDPSPGDVISASDADKVREFILALVKDGTETTTGQTSELLMDADDGGWEYKGREMGKVQSWTPTQTNGDSPTSYAAKSGSYTVVGELCTAWFRAVPDAIGAGASASVAFDLPIDCDTSANGVVASGTAGAGTIIGVGVYDEDTPADRETISVQLRAAGEVMFIREDGTTLLDTDYANDDVLSWTVNYPVASA